MRAQPNHRKIMYALKRGYGEAVTLYQLLSETDNVTTGKTVRTYKTISFRKAPVLPNTLDRSFVYDLDWIQANRNFVKGGFFDRNKRQVVLDGRDIPKGVKLSLNDFIVIHSKRYMVTAIEESEELAAYLLTITTVENQAREKWVIGRSCVALTTS